MNKVISSNWRLLARFHQRATVPLSVRLRRVLPVPLPMKTSESRFFLLVKLPLFSQQEGFNSFLCVLLMCRGTPDALCSPRPAGHLSQQNEQYEISKVKVLLLDQRFQGSVGNAGSNYHCNLNKLT